MSADLRIALVDRPHPATYRGGIAEPLMAQLHNRGARAELIHAETGLHRVDRRPPWDLIVLKSGSAAALHFAAVAEAHGIPCVNSVEATRLAQDRLASMAVLLRSGLQVPDSRLVWLDPSLAVAARTSRRVVAGGVGLVVGAEQDGTADASVCLLRDWGAERLVVKAARGSRGAGVWMVGPGRLAGLAERVEPGPYLIMKHVPHSGYDLKVFVAGDWVSAIWRPFPALTLEEKLGRPTAPAPEVADAARAAGRSLGLSCFGCDFVGSRAGWHLVDVNAFPGYKGAAGAASALAEEILRQAGELG